MPPQPSRPQITTIEDLRRLTAHTALEPLGVEVVEVNDEQIVLRMPITNASRQPMGLLHGGISMLLAETAASMHACWGSDLDQILPVGIEINGSHLRSVSEGTVIAIGKVLRRSVTLIVHQVEIRHRETGKLLSVGRVTNYYKRVRS